MYRSEMNDTVEIATGLPPNDFGALAPSSDGSKVYFLIAKTKEVFILETEVGTFEKIASMCGLNWWRLYNMSLSPDEESVYVDGINNDRKSIKRLDLRRGKCSTILKIGNLVGSRDLCFGGINVWDDNEAFYAPAWKSGDGQTKLAILKATVEKPSFRDAVRVVQLRLFIAGRNIISSKQLLPALSLQLQTILRLLYKKNRG